MSIFFSVLFRVLKIKLNLVKLTAISSHQVMGMSLTKVWVILVISYQITYICCGNVAETFLVSTMDQ